MPGRFTCDGCWEAAVAKARRSGDVDVAGWYAAYHADAHKRQSLAEVRRPAERRVS